VPHHMINKLFHPDPPWSLSFSSFLRYVIWTAPATFTTKGYKIWFSLDRGDIRPGPCQTVTDRVF